MKIGRVLEEVCSGVRVVFMCQKQCKHQRRRLAFEGKLSYIFSVFLVCTFSFDVYVYRGHGKE